MAVVEKCTQIVQDVVDYLIANPAMIAVLLCSYILIFVLSIFLSGKKPGQNPFKYDSREPIRDLVLDQAARDKVLKQGFISKKVPEVVDVIVIGSGIGGLSAAALLAKAGKKVLVLEQHDQAGGCCHTFIEKGFEFDVGIHYVGKLHEGGLNQTLMSQITGGQLQWVKLNDVYDKVTIGDGEKRREFPIPSGENEYREALVRWFPDEEANIDRYLALVNKVDKLFLGGFYLKIFPRWLSSLLLKTGIIHLISGHYKYSRKTLTQVLDEITDNQTLKAVLAYNFGDYGTVPNEASFMIHVTLVKHFMQGAFYPRGGASEIAFHIIPTIEKAGGRVLVRAPVSQILIGPNGMAHGVRVSKTSGDVDVFAPIVVSAVGVVNTFNTLLPKEIGQKSAISKLLSQKRLQPGTGGMSVFVGLDATKEELGVEPMNVWSFTNSNIDQSFHEYVSLSPQEACDRDIPLMFISFPSTKDPTWDLRHPGKTTLAIITLAPWEWFQAWENERVMHRGEEYQSIKDAIANRMWEQVCALYPKIADKKVYMEAGSPLSNQYYIGAARGEFYGLDHDVRRFGSPEASMALRPDTEVPGLWLSGQDISTCGFMGAMFGGIICASAILNRNLINDVLALRKQLRADQEKKEE